MTKQYLQSDDERFDLYFHGDLDASQVEQLLNDIEADEQLRARFESEQGYYQNLRASALTPKRDLKSAVMAEIAAEERKPSKKSHRYFAKVAPVLFAAAACLCMIWNLDLIKTNSAESMKAEHKTGSIIAAQPATSMTPADSCSPDDPNHCEINIEISRWLMPYLSSKLDSSSEGKNNEKPNTDETKQSESNEDTEAPDPKFPSFKFQ